MAEALYRKYRPQIFEDVVGQEHIERTIKNAIEQDKVSHAYLFTGPRGTGKTTTARLLAKALLCQKGPTAEPDGTCEDCLSIAAGDHPDVYELDAASRTGVENVREEIIGRVQFAPTRGRYKIYIIDEVHMLSTAAFNALLKTLEEPPSHVVFILATTDPQKVPETIHSRCQRFDFRRISTDSIVSRLGAICVAEGVDFEGEALELVAHRAEGGMRNALTSLEQLIAFGEGKVTMEVAERMLGSLDSSDLAEIVRFVGMRDVAACFRWTAEFVETGADLAQFTRDFAERIRNMYVMSLAGADVALDVSEAARRELAEELKMFGPDRLARLLGVLGDLSAELKTSTNLRLSFEIALTRMVRPESELTLEALAERIERLEQSRAAMLPVAAQVPVASQTSVRAEGQTSPQVRVDASGERSQGQRVSQDRVAERAQAQANQAGFRQPVASSSAGVAKPAASAITPEPVSARSEETASIAISADAKATASALPDQLVANMRNAAALQRLWQSVMAQLKKAKAAYGVLFINTKALFDEGAQTLIIDFPAENDFAFRAVQKPDVQDELARSIVQVCGVAVKYRLTKAGAGAGASAGAGAGGFAGASAGASANVGVAASAGISAQVGVGSAAAQGGISQARVQQPSQQQNYREDASRPIQSASQAQPSVRQQTTEAAAAVGAGAPATSHSFGGNSLPTGGPSGTPANAISANAGFANAQAAKRMHADASSSADAIGAPQGAQEASDATTSASVPMPDPSAYTYDEVPVDMYDDVVPYDDEPFSGNSYDAHDAGIQNSAAASAVGQTTSSAANAAREKSAAPMSNGWRGDAAPVARAAQGVQASQVVQAVPATQVAQGAGASQPASAQNAHYGTSQATQPFSESGQPQPSGEPTLADLDAMLAFGFGEGVEFHEV